MLKLLILGHSGMLGNAVVKYFSSDHRKYVVETLEEKWGEPEFNIKLKVTEADFVINCIGAIPQRYAKQPEKYKELNIDLPIFLETTGKKIVHPSTDCEFSGKIADSEKYNKKSKRDAYDEYGKSKALISEKIESEFENTKIIRVSIIGHELASHLALLDWALSESGTVKGYANHYWNGITTLEWCKLCEALINNWDHRPKLNQYGTEEIKSKYELLKTIFKIYDKDVLVKKYSTRENVNKCLESDIKLSSIEKQLQELKDFYRK